MQIEGKIQHNQLRLFKQLPSARYRISLADAKYAYDSGKVTKCNKVFKMLAAQGFNTRKTLDYYRSKK